MLKNTFTRNCLALVIMILSLSSTFGFLSQKPAFAHFGQAIGFAPLPLPFRDMGHGRETMYSTQILLISENGVIREDNKFLLNFFKKNHKRPHRAIIPYISIVNFAEAVPDRLRQSILQHFCTRFPKADYLHLEVTFGNGKKTNTHTSCLPN